MIGKIHDSCFILHDSIKKNWKLIFFFLFLILVFIFSLQKIDLTTADLGRHIKNGEVVFKNKQVLFENFYSYTNTSFPFVNHHWGSGVVFFLVHKFFGFTGGSIMFAVVSSLTCGLFFLISWKKSSLFWAVFGAVVCLPLVMWRSEIRPEMFSYLFCGIFWWILDRRSSKSIYFLPFLLLVWINLHSYFFLGFFMIGVYFLKELIAVVFKKEESFYLKKMFLVFVFSLILSLINPGGFKGLLYPLHIFDNFGYRLLENQSIFFLEKVLGGYPPGIYFKILTVLLFVSYLWIFIKKRQFVIENIIFSLFFTLIAFMAVRNFSLFGLFCLPVLASNLNDFKFHKEYKMNEFIKLILLTLLFPLVVLINKPYWDTFSYKFGIGLRDENALSAEFFLNNKIKGPVFNNYDIGGYLIFYLFPQEKVFVDNRPEAYPAEFFTDTYVPMQENGEKWKEIDEKYNFNVIFFQRRDLTPWAQTFLVSRVKDKNWAPVFVDYWTIIFLRRNEQNKELIARFELPKEMFANN